MTKMNTKMKVININSERNGKIAAVVYTAICLLMLFALKCESPKEEYANEGVIVNLGFTESGKSDVVPEAEVQEVQEVVTPPEQVEEAVAEEVEESVTQDMETVDVTASEEVTESTSETVEDVVEEATETVEEIAEEVEELVEEPQADPNALFNGPSNNSNQGEGNENGDQGNENGSIESNIYGDITGPGMGDNGKGWGLSGRSLGYKPQPVSEKQEYGTVTIKIKVAKNGKVINAQFTSKGSTTTDSYLVNLSIQEAYKVTFNPDTNAPSTQTGYVTFIYKAS